MVGKGGGLILRIGAINESSLGFKTLVETDFVTQYIQLAVVRRLIKRHAIKNNF